MKRICSTPQSLPTQPHRERSSNPRLNAIKGCPIVLDYSYAFRNEALTTRGANRPARGGNPIEEEVESRVEDHRNQEVGQVGTQDQACQEGNPEAGNLVEVLAC